MTPIGSRFSATVIRRARLTAGGARPGGSRSLAAGVEAENRMLGACPAQLLLARVWANAVEESSHLELPAFQVGAQQGRLLLVAELDGGEALAAPAPVPATL